MNYTLSPQKQKDFFITDLNAFTQKWGYDAIKGDELETYVRRDAIYLGEGLNQAIQNLDSKSIPIKKLFENLKLRGKPYLVYNKWNEKKGQDVKQHIELVGILYLMYSPFYNSRDYYYIVGWSKGVAVSEEKIKKSYNKISHDGSDNINKLLHGKIWARGYALDINYLLNNNEYQFMNWNKDNPLEVKE